MARMQGNTAHGRFVGRIIVGKKRIDEQVVRRLSCERVAVCGIVLQYVAVRIIVGEEKMASKLSTVSPVSVLQRVVVCHNVLQCDEKNFRSLSCESYHTYE